MQVPVWQTNVTTATNTITRRMQAVHVVHFGMVAYDASSAPGIGKGMPVCCIPALNAGTTVSGMSISAPVAGLRPLRAARVRDSKVPNPTSCTFLPAGV